MQIVVDSYMASRLAFHRIKARTSNYLKEENPPRFSLMSRNDTEEFVEEAFSLCQRVQLLSEEELRYVCRLMTLFGHRFYDDPRYKPVSSILLDIEQQARQRRTQPLVDDLVLKFWGHEQDRRMVLSRICTELHMMQISTEVHDFERDAKLLAPGCLRPDGVLQEFFLKYSKDSMSRLVVEGHSAERICFWATWIFGIDFDRNPQFRWLARSIDKAGRSPEQRQRKLTTWLLRLAQGNDSGTNGEVK